MHKIKKPPCEQSEPAQYITSETIERKKVIAKRQAVSAEQPVEEKLLTW